MKKIELMPLIPELNLIIQYAQYAEVHLTIRFVLSTKQSILLQLWKCRILGVLMA